MLIHLDVKPNTKLCAHVFHVKFTILIGLESPLHHLGPIFYPFIFVVNMPFQFFFLNMCISISQTNV
jgi:hypothetical protein